MVIDFHAHIYPDKIADKARANISNFYGDAPMAWSGRSSELIESGKKIGVEKYIVHSLATKPEQVESINNYIISECNLHSEFVGFGTLHPAYENFEAEIERIKAAGLKGIKLHPDFQQFPCDLDKMDPVYDKIAKMNMPVLFHAGDIRFDYSGPKRIRKVFDKHPDLIIIAAHFGGYTEWDDAMEYLVGQNVYFDTSSTFWKLPQEKAKLMIEKHGYKHFLFGTDFPMWDHEKELETFDKVLGLPPEQRQAILYDNGHELLERISK